MSQNSITTPLPKQVKWQDCEVGVIFHFDLTVYDEGGWHGHARKPLDPNLFSPAELDTDQWLEAAKAGGARYAIFTATHFNGFLQWQSDLYPYGVKQSKWRDGKGDLVEAFVSSCRKYNIEPGLYLSCHRNTYWSVDHHRVAWGQGGDSQESFNKICEGMVEELCSRYGKLLQIWFDAGVKSPAQGGPDVLPIVDKYQPDMVFYHSIQRAEHRWIGNEDGIAGDPCWATIPDVESQSRAHTQDERRILLHGDPDGRCWSPGMCDAPLRDHDWFWKPDREGRIQPLANLVDWYYKSVGRNCNLMLGITPNPNGLVPDADFRRLREFGQEIGRRFGRPLAETAGEGETIELALEQPAQIHHLVIMEDISFGERVRHYVVERRVSENRWEKLCEGISIGHKRIHKLDPVDVKELRLRCTGYVAEPKIRSLKVFGT